MSVLEINDRNILLPQPEEKIGGNDTCKRMFVVHRHLGSILHYDLRIQMNGVFKNWALPSGPSMNCDDKRLAVLMDDAPLSYATIRSLRDHRSGLIESWDKGTIIPHSIYSSGCSDHDIMEQIREGRFRFTLKGRKLKGVFSLVRLNGADSVNWLLLKGNDKYAVDFPYNSENYINGESRINKYLKGIDERKLKHRARQVGEDEELI